MLFLILILYQGISYQELFFSSAVMVSHHGEISAKYLQ